jgi:hypothetical protein
VLVGNSDTTRARFRLLASGPFIGGRPGGDPVRAPSQQPICLSSMKFTYARVASFFEASSYGEGWQYMQQYVSNGVSRGQSDTVELFLGGPAHHPRKNHTEIVSRRESLVPKQFRSLLIIIKGVTHGIAHAPSCGRSCGAARYDRLRLSPSHSPSCPIMLIFPSDK